MQRRYFDYNATTPVSQEVLDEYLPVLRDIFGNASSIHRDGQSARQHLDQARKRVAVLLHCDFKEIVWLSGGTEADNLALFGIARRTRGHVITSTIEHPAVLNACAALEAEGIPVTYVPVDSNCVIDPDAVLSAIRPDTCLISVMHVNNETGTIQPIAAIAAIARERGILFHSDGVQAAGRVPVNVRELGVDLYSLSAHKMSAPKGTGALYVRKGVELAPVQFGGRHEQGRRAGTENVPGAVAMGAAAGWLEQNGPSELDRLAKLRDAFEQQVLERIRDVSVNGSRAPRAPNTSSVCFEGIEGEALVVALDLQGMAVSSGAACSSGAVEPSHVLTAMGLTRREAKSSLRFSFGRANSEADIAALVPALEASVDRLRKLAP